MRELTHLISGSISQDLLQGGIDFRLVYINERNGRVQIRDLGSVNGPAGNGPDAEKTLDECKFVIGDIIDVALLKPGQTAIRRQPPVSSSQRRSSFSKRKRHPASERNAFESGGQWVREGPLDSNRRPPPSRNSQAKGW